MLKYLLVSVAVITLSSCNKSNDSKKETPKASPAPVSEAPVSDKSKVDTAVVDPELIIGADNRSSVIEVHEQKENVEKIFVVRPTKDGELGLRINSESFEGDALWALYTVEIKNSKGEVIPFVDGVVDDAIESATFKVVASETYRIKITILNKNLKMFVGVVEGQP